MQPDTLASQIDLRQTTKRKYDGKLIDKEKLRIDPDAGVFGPAGHVVFDFGGNIDACALRQGQFGKFRTGTFLYFMKKEQQ